ncbi:hypothetical protein HELRODRAFT_192861 [Helobdella robusta]|uniref:Protein kinase domain-containing protein n=1 Tax=Helobdella robusta TaxID=6412 RepID=T1FUD4_HELRO|nr:hypothetical protein HELRODRAFT_192861 [Helobdella robusta]ESN99580.1 hypothetical protein HELRODRAFT_192861 [Helobdella robusta]
MMNLSTNFKKNFSYCKAQKFYNIIHNEWKDIAGEIFKKNSSEPRFSWDEMQVFERSENPAKKIFEAWMLDNITFQDVIGVLEKVKHERAITFLKESASGMGQPQTTHVPPQTADPTNHSTSDSAGDKKDDDFSMVVPYEILCKWTDNFNNNSVSKGGAFISSGGFANVYRGLRGKSYVAVKRFKSLNDEELRTQFKNEINILSRCNHPHLLTLLHYSNDGPLCLVYDYMQNGSLYDYMLNEAKLPSLKYELRMKIFKQCTEALNYLHDNNIIHRDIKSANILLDSDMDAKLGDFGITRIFAPTNDTHVHTNRLIGTALYMAPEYLKYGEVSPRTDMYSMGIVLVELLTGLVALDLNRKIKSILEIIEDEYKMDDLMENDCNNETFKKLKDLSLKLLSSKKNRPCSSEVLYILQSIR